MANWHPWSVIIANKKMQSSVLPSVICRQLITESVKGFHKSKPFALAGLITCYVSIWFWYGQSMSNQLELFVMEVCVCACVRVPSNRCMRLECQTEGSSCHGNIYAEMALWIWHKALTIKQTCWIRITIDSPFSTFVFSLYHQWGILYIIWGFWQKSFLYWMSKWTMPFKHCGVFMVILGGALW